MSVVSFVQEKDIPIVPGTAREMPPHTVDNRGGGPGDVQYGEAFDQICAARQQRPLLVVVPAFVHGPLPRSIPVGKARVVGTLISSIDLPQCNYYLVKCVNCSISALSVDDIRICQGQY